MGDVFLYLALFAVSSWTARLAKSKGRNLWSWGGAALILGLINLPQSALLSVAPILLLMFIESPTTPPGLQPDRLSCARCAKPHSDGQHFCTGCGWDLNDVYSPEDPDGVPVAPAAPVQTQTRPTMPSTATAKPAETEEIPVVESPASESPAPSVEPAPVTAASATEGPDAPADEVDSTAETAAAEAEEEPEEEYVPWGTYEPGIAPTAAAMTLRGIQRFDEGKYQEAIDQFTKAIALDPNYADAWQRRAEAYSQLGRSEQAAQDRRHLQGLDPSSSPG